ncbi:MAG: precorrin-8X methylmutase, partial [Thermodesulfobacteriota bacterium]
AVEAGVSALRNGCRIVTDTRMARAGITQARMQGLGCRVECLLDLPGLDADAVRQGLTRSAAGMQKAAASKENTLFVIGNAPTALFALLQALESQTAKTALIVGMPVGFVGAAESKEELQKIEAVPWMTISGRKGGSALAAACVNALAELALENQRTEDRGQKTD